MKKVMKSGERKRGCGKREGRKEVSRKTSIEGEPAEALS